MYLIPDETPHGLTEHVVERVLKIGLDYHGHHLSMIGRSRA
jgi:hypothetical protein